MAYNNSLFENIDKSCPVAASFGLGAIIDEAYTSIKSNTAYTGELLSETQINALDKMCSASDITDIAYVLNGILEASKNQTTVSEIDAEILEKINNGICSVFQKCALGDKISEMIETVNDMSDVCIHEHTTQETIECNPTDEHCIHKTITTCDDCGEIISTTYSEHTPGQEESYTDIALVNNDFVNKYYKVVNCSVCGLGLSEVEVTKDFLSYSINNVDGLIDRENSTITVQLPCNTDLTSLIATFETYSPDVTITVNNAPQVSGTTTNDFTNSITYTITFVDGTSKNWIVTVEKQHGNEYVEDGNCVATDDYCNVTKVHKCGYCDEVLEVEHLPHTPGQEEITSRFDIISGELKYYKVVNCNVCGAELSEEELPDYNP